MAYHTREKEINLQNGGLLNFEKICVFFSKRNLAPGRVYD